MLPVNNRGVLESHRYYAELSQDQVPPMLEMQITLYVLQSST